MDGLFAVVIDDALVNWIIGSMAVVIPTVSGGIAWLAKKFSDWLGPMITKWFADQSSLMAKLDTQAPVMAETLKKLGQTQDRQCQAIDEHSLHLDEHSEQHKQHATKLDEILEHVRGCRSNHDLPKPA